MYRTGQPDDGQVIGFKWIKEINQATGSYVKTNYYHKDDHKVFQGLVKRQITCDSDDVKYKEVV